MKHPWREYRIRFVLNREWATFPEMQKALALECPSRGMSEPSLKVLQNWAAKHGWVAERQKMEAEAYEADKDHARAMLSRQLRKNVDRLINLQELAQAMLGLGGRHIARMHEAETKRGIPQVTTIYEAESLIRTSALLDRLAQDSLNKLANPDAPAPAGRGLGGDEGDGVQRGIVEVPIKLEPAAWDSQRRLNLGASGQDAGPAAAVEPPKDEEPKP